jgi:hypothetical protein
MPPPSAGSDIHRYTDLAGKSNAAPDSDATVEMAKDVPPDDELAESLL